MVPNPRKPTEAIDFESLFNEFKILAGELELALAGEYAQRGGILIKSAPPNDAPWLGASREPRKD